MAQIKYEFETRNNRLSSSPTSRSAILPRITALARIALTMSLRHFGPDGDGSGNHDPANILAPMAALALEGDATCKHEFVARMRALATERWGIKKFELGSGLNDSFAIRSMVEAYRGLIDAGMVTRENQDAIAPWLYEFGQMRADGSVTRIPGFQSWHLRNQNVPATSVYEIAALLDATQPGKYATAPLWSWADDHMVGWSFNWRTPDDSWLYQFIWIWSAYRHAALRQPKLLNSRNAHKSFDFYRTLSVPGGIDLVFGDTRPMDLLGPMVSLLLGAKLFDDGQLLSIAMELLERQEINSDHWMIAHRAPEFYRLYSLWPLNLQSQPVERQSTIMTSPLAGRGWSIGETPYAIEVKTRDARFPAFGRNTFDWDDLYQVREQSLYSPEKPDKIVLCEQNEPGGMFALIDLRAQGLHDHPDALNLITLIDQGRPWLVESGYMPRSVNRIRWMHNVPLYRRDRHGPEGLRSWKSDTWREVQPGDVFLQRNADCVLCEALLKHDAFDYVSLDGDLFDVRRVCVMKPDDYLLVVDQLVARHNGPVTIGQIWHTPAEILTTHGGLIFQSDGLKLHAAFAQSHRMKLCTTQHEPTEYDPLYFPGTITDLLWHASDDVTNGNVITMAAMFSRKEIRPVLTSNTAACMICCDDLVLQIPFNTDHASIL